MSLPVAPACGLQEGIQAGLLTVDGGKIHIHPRFDERGGNHPTGEPQGETPADLGQLPTAVGGVHQRGEMEIVLPLQALEHGF